MLLEVLVALLLGLLSGVFTGLAPGIHVNLVAVLVVSLSAFLLQFTSPIILAVFIISLAITHTFLDALPSIYLGAPDEAQALNVLPGHRFLLKGEGHQAIAYTVIGSLGSLVLCLALFPFFVWAMVRTYPFISPWIGYFLAGVIVFLIGREKGKKLPSLAAFLLAGSLGLIVFSLPQLNQPLFPLLTGLFGFSLLVTSLQQKSVIPRQNFKKPLTLPRRNLIKSVSAASGMGFVAGFLPGFGSSQAAIIGTAIVGDVGDDGFLTLVGGINTANMLISIGTVYALDKARNGAIVAVNQLLGKIGFEEMLLFLGAALTAGSLAALLTLIISRQFAKYIVKVNYLRLIGGVMVFIALLTFYFDGLLGLAILLTATAIGLVASFWGVGKNHLMGCLILPVILYFIL